MSNRALLLRTALLALAALALLGTLQPPGPPTDTDRRIEFYRARAAGPGTYPAHARLGAALLQKARETGRVEHYAEAQRYLLHSNALQPNQEAMRWLAAVYVAQHRFREALRYAHEAVEASPDDVEALGALFDAYLAVGDGENAAGVSRAMLDRGPGFAAFSRQAALREAEGDFVHALQAMHRACAAASQRTEARAWCHVRLGVLHAARGQPEKARQAYSRALELLPDYYLALQRLAELRAAAQ